MLYSDNLRREIHKIPVPHAFVMDIIEYDEPEIEPFLMLRFYYSQWRTFTNEQKLRSGEYMETVRRIIDSHGINATLNPIYDLDEMPEKGKFV